MASSNEFKITIRGKGSHAALPHNGIDPVPVACQMVQAFQTIVTRNKRPIDTAVISVTMIHAGEATNVVPDFCEIQGTVRTFTTEVLDLVERRMKVIAEATCAAFEAGCEFQFKRNYPPTVNHEAETEFARKLLGEVVGAENVLEFEPTMGSEDFSYFLQAKPGCYFLIGNGDGAHREGGHGMGPCMLHNPSYDFNDELDPARRHRLGAPGREVAGRRAEGLHDEASHLLRAELRRGAAQVPRRGRRRRAGPVPHPHPLLGRDGEALAMDVARFGPADAPARADRQQRLPRRRGLSAARACRTRCSPTPASMPRPRAPAWRVLYIHALNPYGFSWLRRTTHENVDLNRNWHDFSQPLPRNAGLRRDRAPAGARHLAADARGRRPGWRPFVAEHGAAALQTAITGGQYEHPEGLFYGGRNPTWSQQTLRHVLQDHGRRCARLGWIDLHTGLGPSGHGERIFAGRDDAAALRARARLVGRRR